MKPVRTFTVVPSLPPGLSRLKDIAYNLFWSWDHDTRELFRRLDRDLWEECGHNPVLMLGEINQSQLNEARRDVGFLSQYESICKRLDAYLENRMTWHETACGDRDPGCIAYFSAEFGLTDCMPIYSGGLGILAGDHLKSSSELGLPLIGVGLLYQKGYFSQYLNRDGWQQESYAENDFYTLPIQRVLDENERPMALDIPFPDRNVVAQIWRAQVGRISLYLLDTNLEVNRPEDQDITDQLYGGGIETRIQQEIVLGIGGIRALSALGMMPKVCHMNEGHSAFLALERIRLLMVENQLSFEQAREVACVGQIFTTHTSLPVGNDYFPPELVDRYLGWYYDTFGLSRKTFLGLGRQNPDDEKEAFCMTVLALRLSSHRNAVSRLHETVTKKMWAGIWPGVPLNELPLSHVTNGTHAGSWISPDMAELFDRYLGARWREEPGNRHIWKGINAIPPVELWMTYERRRQQLVAFARRRLKKQLQEKGASEMELGRAQEVLDPNALTIGFARRFTEYKRAALLLRDTARLAKLLNHPERPVQILYAGKAHPRDDDGKKLIRRIIHLERQEPFQNKIVFLENYDMEIARYMVQGVDIWLNTPRRGLEASGTSGMKAAANGVLNVSILDGWWDEAYQPELGWAIGSGETYDNPDNQDEVESNMLYDLLEKEVAPMFYERGSDRLPRRWIARMKAAMGLFCPAFNTNRMVREYADCFYLPARAYFDRLSSNGFERAKNLAAWKAQVYQHWPELAIEKINAPVSKALKVGDTADVQAWIRLGQLAPEDVEVALYLGRLDAHGAFIDAEASQMRFRETSADKLSRFEVAAIPCEKSGLHGYTVRVSPRHEDLVSPWDMGLVRWGS